MKRMKENNLINDIREAKGKQNIWLRIGLYVLGCLILAFGVAITYKSKDLGAGPVDALHYGLSQKIGLSIGTCVIIVGSTVVMITAFIQRAFPKLQAIITVLILGQCINLWMWVIAPFEVEQTFIKVICLLVGVMIIALGASIYLIPNVSPTPLDLLTLTLCQKFNKSFRFIKTILEGILLILAWIAGGPVWFGTLFIAGTVGFIVQFFIKIFFPIYHQVMSRD